MKANLKLYLLSTALLAATAARAQGPLGYDIEHDQPRWGESTTVLSYSHPEATDYDFPAPKHVDVGSEYSAGGGSGEPEARETTSQESNDFLQTIWTAP